MPAALFLRVLGSTWGLLGSFFGVLGLSSGPLGNIFGCLGAVLGALGSSWDALGGVLGRSWGDLAVRFRAVHFPIYFLSDFGRPRGAKREAFGDPKRPKIGLKTDQKSVRYLT